MRHLGYVLTVAGGLYVLAATIDLVNPLSTWLGVAVGCIGLLILADTRPSDERRPGYITDRKRHR